MMFDMTLSNGSLVALGLTEPHVVWVKSIK